MQILEWYPAETSRNAAHLRFADYLLLGATRDSARSLRRPIGRRREMGSSRSPSLGLVATFPTREQTPS